MLHINAQPNWAIYSIYISIYMQKKCSSTKNFHTIKLNYLKSNLYVISLTLYKHNLENKSTYDAKTCLFLSIVTSMLGSNGAEKKSLKEDFPVQ